MALHTKNKNPITQVIAITATAIIHAIDVFVWNTLNTPPIPMIGGIEKHTQHHDHEHLEPAEYSFVVLVINDAVENRSNSALENDNTRSNT